MSNTPKTDKLFFPFGRDATAAASPSLLVCMTQFEILERENAAQLAELHRISEALGTNEGHSSVTHIEILREQLKEVNEDRLESHRRWDAENAARMKAEAERDKVVAAFAHLQSFVSGDLQEHDAAEVASMINAALKEPSVTHSRIADDHAIVMVGGGGGGGSAAKEEGK